jgi:hypothetical protein
MLTLVSIVVIMTTNALPTLSVACHCHGFLLLSIIFPWLIYFLFTAIRVPPSFVTGNDKNGRRPSVKTVLLSGCLMRATLALI